MSFYSKLSILDLHWTSADRNRNPKPNPISFGSPNPKTVGEIEPKPKPTGPKIHAALTQNHRTCIPAKNRLDRFSNFLQFKNGLHHCIPLIEMIKKIGPPHLESR